jgi:hypothetical protein
MRASARIDITRFAAAILLFANSVLAAEAASDAQIQARDLLSGTVGGRAKMFDASIAIPADGHHVSNLDPQELARQLILGKPNFGAQPGPTAALRSKTKFGPAVSARGSRRVGSDAQESAQRMILGAGA